jgi:hypothetical protein
MTRLRAGEKIGLVLGLAGALVGVIIALWVAISDFVQMGGPTPGGVIALAAGVVIAVVVWALLLGPMLKTYHLRQRGQPAEATILEVWDTGVTINRDPQVGLRLEVRPPGQPPYQAKTTAMVSRLNPGLYCPGMVVQVLYDPQNPQRVAVESVGPSLAGEWRGGASEQVYRNSDDLPPEMRQAFQQVTTIFNDSDGNGLPDIFEAAQVVDLRPDSAANNPVQRLSQLKELLDAGLITPSEYEAKKSEILSRL